MLVISRKTGEEIRIGDSIKITVVNIEKGVVRLGIEAPKEISIQRMEIIKRNETVSLETLQSDPINGVTK